MKKRNKIILWCVAGLILVLLCCFNILAGMIAPRMIEQQIQQNLKVKAKVGSLTLLLPFRVSLAKLEVGEILSVKKISFTPNLIALLFGKIVIHGLSLEEPVVNIVQAADGKLNLPVPEQKDAKAPEIYLTSLRVKEGRINFTDKKVTTEGFRMSVGKLNVQVAKVALPVTSLETNFTVDAVLLSWADEPFGEISLAGWLDYPARNLDAQLEVRGLDVTRLAVYYGNFLSNRRLASGKLDLVSLAKARDNALNIATKFNLSHLTYASGESQLLDLNLAKNTLDFFTDQQGNLTLEFNIDTLLDKPNLTQEEIQAIILKAAAKNLSKQSPQHLMDKVSSMVDQYEKLGKELKNIFD